MSWNLRDRQKAGLAPKEPPPQVAYNDDLPLPSFGGFSLDDDDTLPPPGWGALRTVREAEGLWTTDQLEAFSWLVRRGVDAHYDAEAAVPLRPSAHEPPPEIRGGGDRGQ